MFEKVPLGKSKEKRMYRLAKKNARKLSFRKKVGKKERKTYDQVKSVLVKEEGRKWRH